MATPSSASPPDPAHQTLPAVSTRRPSLPPGSALQEPRRLAVLVPWSSHIVDTAPLPLHRAGCVDDVVGFVGQKAMTVMLLSFTG